MGRALEAVGTVGTRPPLETFTACELEGMVLPEPRYACAGLIVEGLSFFAGKPKIGKSWAALQLAIAIALGNPWLGEPCERGEVLYLALEDSKRRLQSRVGKILGPEPFPKTLHLATECPRLDQGGLDLVSSWLEKHPGARLAIIDTLAKVKPSRKKNGDIYAEDSAAGASLQTLAFSRGAGIVVVTHTRKASAEDFLEEVSGTMGLTGAADSVLVLKRDRQAEEGTLSVTGRDIQERELALSFTPDKLWVALGAAADVRMTHERREILELMRSWDPGPDGSPAMSPNQIAKTLGKNPGAVRRLLLKMKSEGHIRSGLKYGSWVPTAYSETDPPTTPGTTGNTGTTRNTTVTTVTRERG